MNFKSIAAIIFLTLGLTQVANAQNGALVPAEMPPSDYTGNQYSDSRGCLFIRASFDGQVTWVPRFDANRRPICTTPTPAQTAQQPAVPSPTVAEPAPVRIVSEPAIAPQRIAEPNAPTQATAPEPRRATATPNRPATPARSRLPAGHHAACPAHSPFGELVRHTSGRDMVRCVVSADLMLNPIGGAARPGPIISSPSNSPVPYAPPAPSSSPTLPPDPYGPSIPAPNGPSFPAPFDSSYTPYAPTHGGSFVQVATFAIPRNADRTRHSLVSQGVSTQLHPTRARGQQMQVVVAGPYHDASAAQTALHTARRMGFADAFIRR